MVGLWFFSMVGGQDWMHFAWTMRPCSLRQSCFPHARIQADAEAASLWSISGASLSLWMLGATNHKKAAFLIAKHHLIHEFLFLY
jgi:hypothetical protein